MQAINSGLVKFREQQITVTCEIGWQFIDNHCYKIFNLENVTYYQAQAYCNTQSKNYSYLADIKTETEFQSINSFLINKNISYNGIWVKNEYILYFIF